MGCLSLKAVYPRTYGEHGMALHFFDSSAGLSPYLRGTHQGLLDQRKLGRFIPVPTGNTVHALNRYSFVSVYPRTYGEHSNFIYLFYKMFFDLQNSTIF
ncbi:hypothetical protein XBJ1_3730 [Xenorhabdus bovienii SS-2004]|nr:hypothetical protein XBJ1_3730 [Xenorhabdus bovienii SS-2004]